MCEHTTSTCRGDNYHLKNIHGLKALLLQEALVTVVHAVVTSRIDYCNSLLYGISDYNHWMDATNIVKTMWCQQECQHPDDIRAYLYIIMSNYK